MCCEAAGWVCSEPPVCPSGLSPDCGMGVPGDCLRRHASRCARRLGFRMLQAAEASPEKTGAKRLKTAWLRVD